MSGKMPSHACLREIVFVLTLLSLSLYSLSFLESLLSTRHKCSKKQFFGPKLFSYLLSLGLIMSLHKFYMRRDANNNKDPIHTDGCEFKILLYAFKLAQLGSFESENSVE